MTTWNTVGAIVIALALRDAILFIVDELVTRYYNYKGNKKLEAILDNLWDDLAFEDKIMKRTAKKAVKKKPVKKAVAKKRK